MLVARECTFQDFLKCKPQNFSGTEGVVGLTRWFEKIKTVFNISNCPSKYQVKYATCTMQDSVLTWWNTYKRTIGVDAAYVMNWAKLMRLMTEVYCPRNEIQKMETELWNLTVKGNDLTAYTQRFQELILLCTIMVPDEEDKFERFIEGLPDNIQGNVIASEPTKLQDAIHIANNLKDQKLKGYARSTENKRRFHHEGLCTIRCGNYKKVRHLTRDCRAAVAPNTQRAIVGNQLGVICYVCGRPRHFRKDCPKLRNQNHGNQTRNKNGNKTGSNEATAKAYAIRGGGTNPDSNVVTSMFLLNNCYSSMLFDSGADRSFVSSTFSALLDAAPSTLNTSYAIELAGMDWLAKYHTLIVCEEKVVRIPYGDDVLIIRGGNCDGRSKLNIISCTRTQKYIQKGCQVYLAQVTSKKVEDKSEENRTGIFRSLSKRLAWTATSSTK
ncbi:putative reverse transcriptase domain-containing protein [Tanacetum coccineum]